MSHPIVLAMAGASGAAYGCRLLEALLLADQQVHFTFSPAAVQVMQQELGQVLSTDAFNPAQLFQQRPEWWNRDDTQQAHARRDQITYHHYRDYMTPIASGSFLTAGMVVCPCSGGTLSAIAHAASDNLIVRAADVHLKERRKLIVVPREMPLSTLQLRNMLTLSEVGAVVMPAMPGWYHGVHSLADLVDFVVARILDQLAIPNRLIQRWGAEA